jgi:curved DNA-binding protein CbpA
MLGLKSDASSGEIQAAYFKAAKTWHPDRVSPELADMKDLVQKIFTKLNEANTTLNDSQKRAEYNQLMVSGGASDEEQRKVAAVIDAALEFQKAEVFMRKNDLVQAEAHVARAAAADPEQIDYVTLLAWVQAQRRGDPPPVKEGNTTSFYDDIINILDGVLKKDQDHERALYYRGVLHKRSGREAKAIRDFRMVAELNPKNIDALREIRLNQMRKDAKKEKEAGLLGKIFNKK